MQSLNPPSLLMDQRPSERQDGASAPPRVVHSPERSAGTDTRRTSTSSAGVGSEPGRTADMQASYSSIISDSQRQRSRPQRIDYGKPIERLVSPRSKLTSLVQAPCAPNPASNNSPSPPCKPLEGPVPAEGPPPPHTLTVVPSSPPTTMRRKSISTCDWHEHSQEKSSIETAIGIGAIGTDT